MARGYTYKRCSHGVTGTPRRGDREAVPACKVRHGSWGWRAEGPRDPVTGRRTQPSKGGFPTRDAAQESLSEYLAETGGGRAAGDRRLTLGAWMRRWLADGERDHAWEDSTLERYRRHVDLVTADPVARVRLCDLRPYHLEDFFARIAASPMQRRRGDTGRRKPSSLAVIHKTIRAAVGTAKRRGYIRENTAAGRIDAIGKVGTTQAHWWEPADLSAFLEHVAGDPLESLWVVAAFTGLRRAELCGLRWVDVHLDDEVPGIDIRQRCVGLPGLRPCDVCGGEHRGRRIRPRAKTDAGVRWVPLAGQAVAALRSQADRLRAHQERWADIFVDHGLVWPEPTGEPMVPSWVTKRHAALVAASGQPKVTLHEMRHGAISLMANGGMATALVAIVAGHGSDAVTRSTYIHGLRAQLAAGVQAGADLLKAPTGGGSAQTAHSHSAESAPLPG